MVNVTSIHGSCGIVFLLLASVQRSRKVGLPRRPSQPDWWLNSKQCQSDSQQPASIQASAGWSQSDWRVKVGVAHPGQEFDSALGTMKFNEKEQETLLPTCSNGWIDFELNSTILARNWACVKKLMWQREEVRAMELRKQEMQWRLLRPRWCQCRRG